MLRTALLPTALLLAGTAPCGCAPPTEVLLAIWTYRGDVDPALLADGVEEVDETTARVVLYPCAGDEVRECAEVDVDGVLDVQGVLVYGADGSTSDVTLDGMAVAIEVWLDPYTLIAEGWTTDDRESMTLDVELSPFGLTAWPIGTIVLWRRTGED